MKKIRNSRGDTIVEVLIALAVLITILVGAYATANQSQETNRASKERSKAIKVAESQIEGLRGLLAKDTPVPATIFCIKTNGDGFVSPTTNANGDNPFNVSMELDRLPYQPNGLGECGNHTAIYNLAIKATTVGGTTTYELLMRWDRVGGGREQINMYYRAY